MEPLMLAMALVALTATAGDAPAAIDPAPITDEVVLEESVEASVPCEGFIEVEFCPKSYCSNQTGKRCVWSSGVGRCDQGNCHYSKVDDPTCTTPGEKCSCCVGCN